MSPENKKPTRKAIFPVGKNITHTSLNPTNLFQHQRFLGAKIGTFAASYTFVVIYYRRVKAVLRQCADGAHFNGRTRMVLRTIVLNQIKCFYHIYSLIFHNGIVTNIKNLSKCITRTISIYFKCLHKHKQ